jgi:hypothetical protein
MRPEAMRRADSYYAVGVTRISNAKGGITFESALVRFETLIAAITGGGYYDHPVVNESLALIADRRSATGKVSHIV